MNMFRLVKLTIKLVKDTFIVRMSADLGLLGLDSSTSPFFLATVKRTQPDTHPIMHVKGINRG